MPRMLRRDLIILFIGKLILLTVLFLACFSPKTRLHITSPQMTNHILTNKESTSNARS